MRARFGTLVAETQHIQRSVRARSPTPDSPHIAAARRCRTCGTVRSPSLSRTCAPDAPAETRQRQRTPLRSPARRPSLGDRQRRLGHVNADDRQAQRSDVQSVLAGAAARIQHRSGESAFGCHTHDCWLRLTDVPGRRPAWYDASQGCPAIVRGWSGAGRSTGRQRGFLIAPTTSSPSCTAGLSLARIRLAPTHWIRAPPARLLYCTSMLPRSMFMPQANATS